MIERDFCPYSLNSKDVGQSNIISHLLGKKEEREECMHVIDEHMVKGWFVENAHCR